MSASTALILFVGEESYFIRRLDYQRGDLEPKECAWAFRGAERATVRRIEL